jgi:aspartyl-tRNA(Asn)/glutamyl-tRNA(Gln) amidotransferase subunit A
MYLGDICTVLINIVGIPAMSVPCGFTSEGLPVGLQIMGDRFKEETVIGVANAYQKATSADGFENKIPEEALRGEG